MQTQQLKWQYLLFSFLSLLAIRYTSSSPIEQPTRVLEGVLPGLCQTVSQPNPIAAAYPMNTTGTLNGTVSVVPISLELALKLIPSEYRILEHAYRHLLPWFPKGMYPAVVQAMHDHDVQAFGFRIADFSRAGIEFPFLDLLGDNSTSFKWVPSLLMSNDNAVALQGAAAYGIETFPATFDPACDAYQAVPDAKEPGTTWFAAKSTQAGAASLDTRFSCTDEAMYPLDLFVNMTNQVMFADAKSCDNMIRLFNTSLSTSPNSIQRVKGTVRAKMPPFDAVHQWNQVHGIRFSSAFIENNYLPCENFRGYGSG